MGVHRRQEVLSLQKHTTRVSPDRSVGMVGCVQFDQTKFLCDDVEGLASFYVDALECETVVSPLQVESEVSRAVGVPDATITLTILRLPGRGERGPVLELYSVAGPRPDSWPYRPGQGQIAFEVDHLETGIGRVIAGGGRSLGEVVEWQAPSGAIARFVYLNDPEGNIIDLFQRVG